MKKPKQKEVTIKGTKYLLQRPSRRYVDEMKDRCMNKQGILLLEKYNKESLKNVVVQPSGLTFSDFEDKCKAETSVFLGEEIEYELITPSPSVISSFGNKILSDKGVPSEVKRKEFLMEHVIRVKGQPVDYDFFEDFETEEFDDVIRAAQSHLEESEFSQLVAQTRRFLERKGESAVS